MDVILYHVFCLIARKKIFVNVSYLLGTVAFISLSFNTATKLSKIPTGIYSSILDNWINVSRISNNESFLYEERTNFLKDKCYDKSNPSISRLTNLIQRDNTLDHLGFVLRSHSLFYCSVPKVATRTLLPYITYLHIRDELITSFINNSNSNLFNENYLNQMISTTIKNDSSSVLSRLLMAIKSNSSSELDFWLMYQKSALPYVRLRTLSDPSILFSSSFTRAIFVRHPFERLASAYADKIASFKAEPFTLYDTLRRAICRKFSSSYLTFTEREFYQRHRYIENQMNEPCGPIIPTFEHFIEYIMSNSAQVDVHWRPYSTLCNACTMKYNFIGKYETIQEDLNILRLKLGLNSTDLYVDNHFSTGKTKENYKLMYSKLPDHLICNLKNFYQEDFKLFNYRLEDYLINYQNINCSHSHYRRF